MTFFKNLQVEQAVEVAVAAFLCSMIAGATFFLSSRTRPDSGFDFGIKPPKSAPVLCELKHDRQSAKTGRIFVETRNTRTGKPSGLRATKSDRCVCLLPGTKELLTFEPQTMLQYLDRCSDCRRVAMAGDSNAEGYTVPLRTLKKEPFIKSLPYDC